MIGLTPLMLFATIGLAVWSVRMQLRAVRTHARAVGAGALRVFGATVLPSLVGVLVYAVCVGLEELFATAIISEEISRTLLIVLALNLLLALAAVSAFGLSAGFAKRRTR